MERKNIVSNVLSWAAKAVALSALAWAAGCGNSENLSLAPKPLFDEVKVVDPPEFGPENGIRLTNGTAAISLGSDVEQALALFPRPKNAYDIRELPAQFPKGYHALGWESDTEGWGLISYQGMLALALRQYFKVDESRVQIELGHLRDALGREQSVASSKVARYWFWQSDRRRMSLCVVRAGSDTYNVSIALGELNVMDGVRLNPNEASADALRAERSASATSVPSKEPQ